MLAALSAKKYVKIIKEETKDIKCEIGGINSGKLWQLKKRLCPKVTDPPSAMVTADGHIVMSNDDIRNFYKKIRKESS